MGGIVMRRIGRRRESGQHLVVSLHHGFRVIAIISGVEVDDPRDAFKQQPRQQRDRLARRPVPGQHDAPAGFLSRNARTSSRIVSLS